MVCAAFCSPSSFAATSDVLSPFANLRHGSTVGRGTVGQLQTLTTHNVQVHNLGEQGYAA